MLTMPEFAFLALCRLAKPLASPGPRCSSVEAGVPFMRKYPSAAPVTTPSNRPSTQRMPSTRSRAATKCISEVPGLAKQTSTPPATKVRTRLSAPFMLHSRRDASLFLFVLLQINHYWCVSSNCARTLLLSSGPWCLFTYHLNIAALAASRLAKLHRVWPVCSQTDIFEDENDSSIRF